MCDVKMRESLKWNSGKSPEFVKSKHMFAGLLLTLLNNSNSFLLKSEIELVQAACSKPFAKGYLECFVHWMVGGNGLRNA